MMEPRELRRLLRYEPETGRLFWLPRPEARGSINARLAGKEALITVGNHGYRYGGIMGQKYLAHRVIFALTEGRWPTEIDHINGIRSDNQRANLREVTRTQNGRNAAMKTTNTSGVNGVDWVRRANSWRVRVGGKHIGYFKSFDDAASAWKSGALAYGFHPNHGRTKGA